MSPRDVVITGIGLVSCLGEGVEAHLKALRDPALPPPIDIESFAPYPLHRGPEIDWSLQIPKKSDLRQMEGWQRLGVYTAGLALADAGVKDDTDYCSDLDMIVAASGGERDLRVDEAILPLFDDPSFDTLLNERLINNLRPTLFLAQLSNLMAGNISIVHKVTGSSRTMMGEESCGISAIETAVARLASGQSTHMLVGGAMNSETLDKLLVHALGHSLHQGGWQPLWERSGAGGGVIPGTGAAFLLLETREHAEQGGRNPYAVIHRVVSDRARRLHTDLAGSIAGLAGRAGLPDGGALVISGASGAPAPTSAEEKALGAHALRGVGAITGHLREAQFPFSVAIAALALSQDLAPPPFAAREKAFETAPEQVVATTIGFESGEGIAVLGKA